MQPRVCLITDCLVPPYDEGARNIALGLLRGLRESADVLAVSTAKQGPPGHDALWLPMSRPLLSTRLWDTLRRFQPQLALYLPCSSASLTGLATSQVLRRALPGAAVVLVAYQPRRYGVVARRLAPRLAPEVVLCFSNSTAQRLARLGVCARAVPMGVDAAKFHPVSPVVRLRLRRQYAMPQHDRIALHAGHLKPGRNVNVLAQIAQLDGWSALLVASTSTPADPRLADQLRSAGVRIWRQPAPNVEHFYQLADCCVFPVTDELECAETPLSALEAVACRLPVVTTRFGGLPEILRDEPGVTFVDSPDAIAATVQRLARDAPRPSLPARLTWPRVAEAVLRACGRAKTRPRFICITGMDGGGKTTQARRLVKTLNAQGIGARYIWCRGRPLLTLPLLVAGRRLLGAPSLMRTPRVARTETREMAQAEASYQAAKTRFLRTGVIGKLWLWLNRWERLAEAWLRVLPSRWMRRTIVCDRYVFDSLVDLAAARGEADGTTVWCDDDLFAKLLPKPDLVCFIDVDVDTAMARKDDIPSRDYLERRRGLYAWFAHELGWVVLDGAASLDAVAASIWRRVCGQGPAP